jgi:fatty acid desaturase/SAM-dependent methyltransferase
LFAPVQDSVDAIDYHTIGMNPTLEEEIPVPVHLSDVLTTAEIRMYRRPVAWRQVVDFGLVWIQILLGIGVFAWSPGITTYILAALLIGGGQHGLGLVAHEFIHYNVVPGNRKLNDFLGTWLFAAPGGIPFSIFRYRHFLHHRYYSTDRDTKTIYRIDIRGMKLWPEIFKRLFLIEYFNHVFAVVRSVKSDSKSRTDGPPLIKALPALAVTHAIIFVALWTIHPLAYFFLWLAPLLTLQMLFFNFRAITEHQPLRREARSSDSPYFLGTAGPFVRTAGANLIERLFLCKINFGYHVEHHLWPQINYQFLPVVHERMIERNVFSDSRFALEKSFTSSVLKLVRQDSTEDRSWYARPVSHGISKVDVPQCPLCDSSRKRQRYTVQEHEYDNTTDDRFNMVECLECGAWYLDPRPADSELGTIYPPNYYSNVLEAGSAADLESAKKGFFHRLSLGLFKRRIRPIEKHLQFTSETRWLDIGCGFGMALESMYQVHGIRGVGVDMSEQAVSICRQRGFEAHVARIEDFMAHSETKFQFIHSSHLIEHVASPLSYLKKVYDLLEPGGITIFITPNTNTWESGLFKQHWGGLHVPRHWVLFNADCAIRAATRIGFEHIETAYSTNSQFWIWSFHSLLGQFLPRKVCDVLFPSDHRFVKSSIWLVLRGGLFTAVDMLTVLCTGRSSNMGVILRKPRL